MVPKVFEPLKFYCNAGNKVFVFPALSDDLKVEISPSATGTDD